MPTEKQQKVWRIIDLINWGITYYSSKNISNARREVEWLLCYVLHCQRIDLYLRFDEPLSLNELNSFKKCVIRRNKGEPFQYIIRKAPFYNRDYYVNPTVLIPRPETELIIDVLKKKNKTGKLLDIGTGSGCLVITAMLENLCENATATDISQNILQIAEKNREILKTGNINFKVHDFLLENFNEKFDVIMSNPPYVNVNELTNLQTEIKKYEPQTALTDNSDGLTFYRRFSTTAREILNPGGFMLLEFGGKTQYNAIKKLFENNGFNLIFYEDLQHEPRVVEVQLI